ncbi:MAG: FkbM family methyltransferase [Acidimicrobiales bacterium]
MSLLAAKNRVFGALDQPGRRWLLELLGTVFVTVKRRQRCRVRYRDGLWLHHYAGGVVIAGSRIGGPIPRELTEDAADRFGFDYFPVAGDVVVDIGAGFGEEAMVLSRIVGATGRILSFEAHPRVYRGLRIMCELNKLDNVETFNIAVMAEPGMLHISDDDPIAKGNTVMGQSGGIDVQGRTLDSVVHELGLTRIDLVKMNIEGAEVLALQGMVDALHMTRHIFVECHDFLAETGHGEEMRTKASVRAFLESHGFEVKDRPDARPWMNDSLYGVNARL